MSMSGIILISRYPLFFQKLIATLLKELDDCARKGIRDELSSLDPLLRNVAVPEDGQNFHDFE